MSLGEPGGIGGHALAPADDAGPKGHGVRHDDGYVAVRVALPLFIVPDPPVSRL